MFKPQIESLTFRSVAAANELKPRTSLLSGRWRSDRRIGKSIECHSCVTESSRAAMATVELAVVLPVLLIIVFGTIEVCQRIFIRQSAVIVAYEGARLAARGASTNADVIARCSQLLTSRRVFNAQIGVTPANFLDLPTGTEVRVTIDVPWADNSPTEIIVPNQGSLTVSAFMLRE